MRSEVRLHFHSPSKTLIVTSQRVSDFTRAVRVLLYVAASLEGKSGPASD
jgi:hypothetical protein